MSQKNQEKKQAQCSRKNNPSKNG